MTLFYFEVKFGRQLRTSRRIYSVYADSGFTACQILFAYLDEHYQGYHAQIAYCLADDVTHCVCINPHAYENK